MLGPLQVAPLDVHFFPSPTLRPGQMKHFPPHRRLLFNVAAAMPRLDVDLVGMPKAVYQVSWRLEVGGWSAE